jgi:membrane dipeptidase
MTYLIDAHQDLAYNSYTFNRDYRRSVEETRRLEAVTQNPRWTGNTLLGWPEFQRGQVALIIGTLFSVPRKHKSGEFDTQVYADFDQARKLYHQHIDFYERLAGENPGMFQLVKTRRELQSVLKTWQQPADYPALTHPVGIVMSLEGAEGIGHPDELAEYWERGLRLIGPVWSGLRLFGGTLEGEGITRDGEALLEVMQELGFTLDIAHMNEHSALQALDRFEGPVIASHANARALLRGIQGERHLTDQTIRRLLERDGIMGVMLFNKFLKVGWSAADNPREVTLDLVLAHIDYICQMAGDAQHVAIGTDFDGGFGKEAVPYEIDSIADLQKLAGKLAERGYSEADVEAIFNKNWQRMLEKTLPD